MGAGRPVGVRCAGLVVLVAGTFGQAQCPVERVQAAARPSIVLIDGATGQTWAFSGRGQLPGAPPRLLRLPAAQQGEQPAGDTVRKVLSGPMIRAGDRLKAVDCHAGVDAQLEAIALEPALQGAQLKVRTRVFGATLNAFAIAPGQVLLTPVTGAER